MRKIRRSLVLSVACLIACSIIAVHPATGQMCPMDSTPSNAGGIDTSNPHQAKLTLNVRDGDSTWIVTATLIALDSTGKMGPIGSTPVNILAKRLFGLMPVSDESPGTTDAAGNVDIAFPKDIPGNAQGVLTLIARVDDNDRTGAIESRIVGPWGRPVAQVADPFPRALWEPRAPIAMIITFCILFGGVWTTYGFILTQLVNIKKGKHDEA
ncbi:MAG: hypothetical protein Q8922_00245 [Bacteroidota bacterium]|nr:hypothetical protein [Bacteroidota bacterium]MDP4232463.1 hypothetical protein [Bacteroidota bacterium]MDP4241599.1 hypothetical protein [Bacteroidota bacterium]MDP4286343.1 hypothetical protein [Bacteroidota bacterium]